MNSFSIYFENSSNTKNVFVPFSMKKNSTSVDIITYQKFEYGDEVYVVWVEHAKIKQHKLVLLTKSKDVAIDAIEKMKSYLNIYKNTKNKICPILWCLDGQLINMKYFNKLKSINGIFVEKVIVE